MPDHVVVPRPKRPAVALGAAAVLVLTLLPALLLPAAAGAAPPPLPPPPPPPAAQQSANIGILNVSPDQGVAGTPVTISGSHLPANAAVELTWSTANVTWVRDPEPDTVNYLGRAEEKFAVVLAMTTTDKSGSFTVSLSAPQDWGGVHDIYA